MIEFTIMSRRPQETTRLSLINRKYGAAKGRLGQFMVLLIKTATFFFLKVKKLDEEVIDIGREFQILGP